MERMAVSLMLLALFIAPVFAQVSGSTNSDILSAINAMNYQLKTQVGSLDTRLQAIQRDIFNVKNDTHVEVQTLLDAQKADVQASLDALDKKTAARMDVIERDRFAIFALFIGVVLLVLAFVVLPLYIAIYRRMDADIRLLRAEIAALRGAKLPQTPTPPADIAQKIAVPEAKSGGSELVVVPATPKPAEEDLDNVEYFSAQPQVIIPAKAETEVHEPKAKVVIPANVEKYAEAHKPKAKKKR